MEITKPAVKNIPIKESLFTGLSEKEAKRKLEQHGLNILKGRKRVSAFNILMSQFTDLMVIILLAATAVSAFMGEMTEAITIIAIVVLNAILGFVQEYKTERTLEALKGLAAPTAKVQRDGKLKNIPAANIVPGDLIILEPGDRVPADGVLFDVKSLFVDESILTGESVPVEKSAGKGDNKSIEIGNKACSAYMGTIVTGGKAKALTYATGMNTEMGKIADMIVNIEAEDTPLQKKLEHLGKVIAIGCLLVCAVVAVTGVLRGEQLFTMLLSGISLAVAAVPEGLPAIVTISLALGVQRMLKRNALIRKLPAVETLGCAGVICSDKTGTLTENKMTVKKIFAGGSMIEVEGNGFIPEGSFIVNGKRIKELNNPAIPLALEIGALCNNSRLVKTKSSNSGLSKRVKRVFADRDSWKIEGDPTEGALLVVASKAGLTEGVLSEKYTRTDELPFDSDRKCMSVICEDKSGEVFVFTKGAPDIVIGKCNRLYTARGIVELTPSMKLEILNTNDKMAQDALRVLGTAYKRPSMGRVNRDKVESELVFVGLSGMIDPPRKEAIEAVQKCRLAGIKPVMITGDHKMTACAVARELNIFSKGDRVVTGNELEKMDETMLAKIVDDISVFARVTPRHKLMIVKALKKRGHVVAMTGDGVNDAPAVKEADIGIAMGITGTDVTKEASSMVLLDDNFATIVAAIEEGRVIYNNIRKFIRYMLACNLGEVLTMFLGMLLGLPLPLLPIQILWVNLVTDGLPAIALGFDPPEADIMMRPPRGSKDNIFSHGLWSLILYRGVLIGLCTLAVFTSTLHFVGDLATARTAGFVTLMVMQLIHVFECKSESKSIFHIPFFNNMYLIFAALSSLSMVLGVVYIPFMQKIFKTVPLNLNDWTLILGFSFLGPVASSFFRVNRIHLKKRRR